ncbi:MAG TPA: hypothetical protein VEC57_07815 [Candidatus Limnocylindrales bacterium]|nr:hypothetical protein [Candidatus Limnocylindrales bacterium]
MSGLQTSSGGRGRKWLSAAVAAASVILTAAATAQAEPYMALREGFTCGDCHTNKTGGGMRNVTAEMHAAQILRLPNDGKGILPAHESWFSPNINDYFSVGADFRLTETLTFQKDDNNGHVENNTAFRPLDRNDFDLAQGTIYAHLRLIPEILSLYVDERVAPGGASNNEGFALLEKILPWDTYIKAGRFFPGFGLRFEDDFAFVNSATGFNFSRTLNGVEIGRSALGWNWNLSASEGGNKFNFVALINGMYMWDKFGPFNGALLGASFVRAESTFKPAARLPEDPRPDTLHLDSYTYALYGGFSIGDLTVALQGSLIDSEEAVTDTRPSFVDDNDAWIAYVEANYLLFDWLNVKGAFDWHDPNNSDGADVRNRVSIGLEPFLDRFLQLRLFYRVYNGPEDEPQTNQDTLTLEGHLFF